MKHTLTMILTLCLLLSLLAIGAGAKSEEPTVTVTVIKQGSVVAALETVNLTDADGDGALTVCDALYAVHEKLYEGGATAGFGYYTGEYGLSMSKLWGDESGMFGYYLNNASCTSLADPVKDGDSITAFIYQSEDWSDVYTYFDVTEASVSTGEEITLTLMAAGYDENWNPISYPVEGAVITLNGNPVYAHSTSGSTPMWETDENGQVTISINTLNAAVVSYVIGARCPDTVIVPPVCKLTVSVSEATNPVWEEPGEQNSCSGVIGAGLVILLPLAYVCIRRKEK